MVKYSFISFSDHRQIRRYVFEIFLSLLFDTGDLKEIFAASNTGVLKRPIAFGLSE